MNKNNSDVLFTGISTSFIILATNSILDMTLWELDLLDKLGVDVNEL